MAEIKKLGELAKALKITNKDIIAKLADYDIKLKTAASAVTDEQISLALDIYTQLFTMTAIDLSELKETMVQSALEQKEKEKSEAQNKQENEPQAEKEVKETENKENEHSSKISTEAKPVPKSSQTGKADAYSKAETKAEAKPAADPSLKASKETSKQDKSAVSKNEASKKTEQKSENEKAQKRKKYNKAKKQTGTKIDLSSIERNGGEAYVVTTQERKRHVDTRQSNVDLAKIESRERIENMVSDDIRMGNGKNKERRNKNRQNENNNQAKAQKYNQKNLQKNNIKNNQKNKQKTPIPKKVITEVEIPETITVGEFASKIGKTGAIVVKRLFMMGVMATMNQMIDYETAALIGADFGIEVKQEVIVTKEEMLFAETDVEDKPEDLVERPPVVVVMGHVDHGKTSLLDAIRDTHVTNTEAGGITQHIGAYSVKLNDRVITFLDTPGHEAFTTMRARGAQVTDIAILVVAADDGIMPQTIEAINHAKAAGVTVIVAINKIDKDGANPERVKQSLVEYDLVPEEWGGDTVICEVSAKKRQNIDGLLEMVLLVADMLELKANPKRSAKGTVIEARVDKGKGPVATVLVQNGTLNVGDVVIAGTAVGHVRAMVNDVGRRVKSAGPSMPVEIQGFGEAPLGGDILTVVSNEKLAREVAAQRKQDIQEDKFNSVVKVSLDNLFSQIDEGNMKELDIIVKADVQGSVEAVKQSLEKLSNDEVRVKVIHGGVGAINESDVMLANASNAIIVGFNVRPDVAAVSSAQQQDVDIRLYSVIYQAIEEIEAAMKGMLDPEFEEKVLGYAEVRQTFKVSSVGTIAGCYVTQGKIVRNAKIRLVRNGIVVHEGAIDSLKRFKDDAKEVMENFECGLSIENYNDIKEGDTLECFVMQEVER